MRDVPTTGKHAPRGGSFCIVLGKVSHLGVMYANPTRHKTHISLPPGVMHAKFSRGSLIYCVRWSFCVCNFKGLPYGKPGVALKVEQRVDGNKKKASLSTTYLS